MIIRPLTLAQANDYVEKNHRHHKKAQGHRFSIACVACDVESSYSRQETVMEIIGVAIIGRPVARECNQYHTAEVTRLCTNGGKNVCSFLYAAAARICREMGFAKIQTYILDEEPGTTLIAAGWEYEATTAGGDWNHSKANAGTRRTDQPQGKKKRYGKHLNRSLT